VEEMRRIIPRLLVFLDHDVTPCRKGLDFIHCMLLFYYFTARAVASGGEVL